ncbi:MAG: hypothetical protein ACTHJ7_08345 [Candidatus Nitrosocosmicus sp.]
MNIKIGLMLVTMVLIVSVATMILVSNPAFAVKPPHPHNHGACVSENAKAKDPGSNNKDTAHAECAHIGP